MLLRGEERGDWQEIYNGKREKVMVFDLKLQNYQIFIESAKISVIKVIHLQKKYYVLKILTFIYKITILVRLVIYFDFKC